MMRCNGVSNYWYKEGKRYVGADSRKMGFSFKSLEGRELMMIKENFPEDYEKLIHLYPFAGAGIKRIEEYDK